MPYKKPIISLVVLIVVFILVTITLFLPASLFISSSSSDVDFGIEKGSGLNIIANELERNGLVRSALLFKTYVLITGQHKSLKAGTYTLSYNMSISDITRILTEGSSGKDVAVTIPEGSNINDIDNIFSRIGLTSKGAFLNSETLRLEGSLFPDTYRFPRNRTVSVKEITDQLTHNYSNKAYDLALVAKNEREVVIIASIIEKEVKTETDMGLVSGVIKNRLSLDMPLQIDATVAYGVCYPKFLTGQNCEVTQANIIEGIAGQSSFNSYKNKGLPPGPISNPGLQSINAALHPTQNDYLYYLSDKNGITHFAKTASEHQFNRAKYLGL